MSKLYSMIEDALTKKGLNLPSDAFTFTEDNTLEDELKKYQQSLSQKDDVYKKEDPKDTDLKANAEEPKIDSQPQEDELDKAFMPAFKSEDPKERKDFSNWLHTLQNGLEKNQAFMYILNQKPEVTVDIFQKAEGSTDPEDLYRAIDNKKLKADFWRAWHPYRASDIEKVSGRLNHKGDKNKEHEDIISTRANVKKVREILARIGIDEDFILGGFFLDIFSDINNEKSFFTIGGVPADEALQDKYIYLTPWHSEANKEEDYYTKSNSYIKVPVNMLRQALIDQEPQYRAGMDKAIVNKGKYYPLTDDQIRKVLVSELVAYKAGVWHGNPKASKLENSIFNENLLKIYEENPGSALIKLALKAFEPRVTVMKNTKNNTITYYIFIPYVTAENTSLDINVQPVKQQRQKFIKNGK